MIQVMGCTVQAHNREKIMIITSNMNVNQIAERMGTEATPAYVLNESGSRLLADWVRSVAKNPADQNMDAWATEAEDVANNAGPDESIIVEMRGFMTASGRPETLTLPRAAFSLTK